MSATALSNTRSNYKLGAVYSLVTSALLATQHPFSLLAAKEITVAKYIFVTELVLLLCVPVMLRTPEARRDFRTLLTTPSYLAKNIVLLLIGLAGLLLYNIGLSKAHPIVIAAILNLSPFWAALVALLVLKKSIPTSAVVFTGCFAVAFAGAMLIALSQTTSFSIRDLGSSSGAWLFAIPVPLLYALSGTLIGKWFGKFDDAACIAVTFTMAAIVLLPVTFVISFARSDLTISAAAYPALVLLVAGTVLSTALGRVLYQLSLSITGEDNGFVSMFFLLVPAITCALSLAMAPWIPELRIQPGVLLFAGLILVAAPILAFSWRTWKDA